MAREENDEELIAESVLESEKLEKQLEHLEIERMFSGSNDNDPCYMDIHRTGPKW